VTNPKGIYLALGACASHVSFVAWPSLPCTHLAVYNPKTNELTLVLGLFLFFNIKQAINCQFFEKFSSSLKVNID